MPADACPVDALRCPRDGGPLSLRPASLHCPACETDYPLVAGIPDFVGQADASTARWQAAQRYELRWWTERGRGALAESRARWAAAAEQIASRFDALTGETWRDRVLHVGPSGHGEIHYLPARECWAAEPLAIALDRAGLLERENVHWVAAMGESLPFADGWFSAAVVPNVIDHVADPARLLAELHRCLAAGAPTWITGHVTRPVLAPVLSALSRTGAGYFAGHPWTFTGEGLRSLVNEAGFRIVQEHAGAAIDTEAETSWRGRIKGRVLGARYFVVVAG